MNRFHTHYQDWKISFTKSSYGWTFEATQNGTADSLRGGTAHESIEAAYDSARYLIHACNTQARIGQVLEQVRQEERISQEEYLEILNLLSALNPATLSRHD